MLTDKLPELKVVDKLPPPIPLLKSSYLHSEKFKSFIPLQHQPISTLEQITQQNPLGEPSKLSNIEYPFKKISDILLKEQKIIFNLLDKNQSAKQETFGVEYYGDHIENNKQKYNYGKHQNNPIKFESRFECGNLSLAYQNSKNDFLLVVRPDYNTTSFCQWFYFQVANTSGKDTRLKLSIINMTKSSSLFSQGMKIMTLSSENSRWERSGENICYSRNNLKRFNGEAGYHTLSWNITIRANQTVMMAYSQPYSYTKLNTDLDRFEQSKYAKRSILSRSILDNRIDALTICEGKQNKAKNIVIITARCHPVETVSSYVMKGIIQFLISEAPEAVILRSKFIFKLIPMVNPDGVIHGNSRCTLAGVDPNRRWAKPTKQIFDLKKYILKHKDRLIMYIDLHGHSKKKNIFTYGCNDRNRPFASRELPYIFSKLSEAFSFKDCNFRVNKYKEGTARITLWKTLKIHNIFTLESSFCSSQKSNFHLDEQGYKGTGANLCRAINICLSNYFSIEEEGEVELKQMRLQMTSEMQNQKDILKIGMEVSDSSESQEQHLVQYVPYVEKQEAKIFAPLFQSRLRSNKSLQINSRYKEDLSNTQSNSLLNQLRSKRKMNRIISQVSLEKKLGTTRSNIDEKQKTLQHENQICQKDQYKLNFKIKSHSKNVVRIKNPIKSLTPRSFLSGKIINFDFAAKLDRQRQRDREEYLRKNQSSVINNSKQRKSEYEALLSTMRKDNFKAFAESKLKFNEQPKRSTMYKRNNILSRLELFMKKVVDK